MIRLYAFTPYEVSQMTPYAQLILLGGGDDGAKYKHFATDAEYRQWLRTREQ